MNQLFYGDNLGVLRESVSSESIDLVYLDPPFNSNSSYNVLFKSPAGEGSEAQIEAFDDTWHWNESAERAFEEVMSGENSDAATMLRAMRAALGENDMMAYLAMMAIRLMELRRVLKPTGTLYLHCDQTASHYLKIILDAIFGAQNYRNEIIWKRSNPKSLGSINFPNCTDTILRFSKGSKAVFHQPYEAHDPNYVEKAYRYSDERGVYRLLPLLNPNDNRPNLTYEFLGVTRVWRWTKERMNQAYKDGLVVQLKPGAVPQYKKYLNDSLGRTVTNCWTDIPQAAGNESLGYPTQKPVALLERIIAASSNEGDLVLDPFCGCGTSVHAAQKLNRRWIGIDITHLAISLIERRLREAFPDLQFDVRGVPTDYAGARDLANRNKHEFQKWITATIGAQPYKGGQKGMDRGIDGYLNFRDANNKPQFGIISVKGGTMRPGDVRDLKGTMDREKAALGLFLCLNKPTQEMEKEAASAGFYETGGMKVPKLQILTAEQILDNRRPQVPFGFTEGFKKAIRETVKQERLF
jgi:site-specific DNA-methyltransferase (adenine-specific)